MDFHLRYFIPQKTTMISGILSFIAVFSTNSCQYCPIKEQPFLKYNEKEVFSSDMPIEEQRKLYIKKVELYRLQQEVARKYVINRFLSDYGQIHNLSIQDSRRQLSPPLVQNDAKLREFYERHRSEIPYDFETVKGEIEKLILSENENITDEMILKMAGWSNDAHFLVEEPRSPLSSIDTSDLPFSGQGTEHQVIAFIDFTCPYCKKLHPVLTNLVDKYGKRLKVFFVFLSAHSGDIPDRLFQMATCANEIRKFEKFSSYVFENQLQIIFKKKEELVSAAFAKSEQDQILECMDQPGSYRHIKRGKALGTELGFQATPRLVVDGQIVTPEYSYEKLVNLMKL